MDNLIPFRLVFSNFHNNNELKIIPDLIEWRTYQSINEFDFIVLKIGHFNTLELIDFDFLHSIFYANKSLNHKPIKFSLYQTLESFNDDLIIQYINFAKKMKLLNKDFVCTIAWVYNQQEFKNNFSIIPEKNEFINYNLYLHQINNSELAYTEIQPYLHLFTGFDITGEINNFNQYSNNQEAFSFLEYLKYKDILLLEKIAPEFLEWEKNDKNFKDELSSFCKNGFIIKNGFISPLIYGSFDDFTFNDKISINSFLLSTFSDINQIFYKKWIKLFLKSYCSKCDHFSLCQNKNYYWINLESNECSLKLENTIELKFDKNTD